jgi:hypothetical protein
MIDTILPAQPSQRPSEGRPRKPALPLPEPPRRVSRQPAAFGHGFRLSCLPRAQPAYDRAPSRRPRRLDRDAGRRLMLLFGCAVEVRTRPRDPAGYLTRVWPGDVRLRPGAWWSGTCSRPEVVMWPADLPVPGRGRQTPTSAGASADTSGDRPRYATGVDPYRAPAERVIRPRQRSLDPAASEGGPLSRARTTWGLGWVWRQRSCCSRRSGCS